MMRERLRFLFNYPIRYAIPGTILFLLTASLTWGYAVSLQRENEIIEQNAVSHMQIDLAFLQDSIEHAAARGHKERPQQLLGAVAINLAVRDAFLADESDIIIASMQRDDIGQNALAVIRKRNAVDPGLEMFLRQIKLRQRSLMQLSGDRASLFGFYPIALPPVRGKLTVGRGWLYMQRDLKAARTVARGQVLYTLAQTFGPVVLFTILVLVLSHYGINRRLRPLLDQAARIGAGDFRAESRLIGRDEFAVLSRALDSMADNLTKNLAARQRAEQVLQESESILSSFYSVAPLRMAMVQVIGTDIIFLRVNPAAAADLGGTPDVVQYKKSTELSVSPSVVNLWREKMLVSKQTGRPVHFEYSVVAEGRETFMSATTVHVPGTAANRLYFALIADDITERKRIENALRGSEAEYRSLFDDALDLIHICDVNGRIVDANQAELRAMGYGKQEYLGKNLLDVVHPASQDRTAMELKRVLDGQALHEFPMTMLNRNGSSVHVIANVFPHFDRYGSVVQVRAMMRDVTEKEQKEQLLSSILNTAIDGIVTTDESGTIQMANRAAERLLWPGEGGLAGQNFPQFIGVESMRALFQEKPVKIHRARRFDGAFFPIELGISTFRLDEAEYYTVFFRDVTHRRSLEEQLDHSRRMEAVGKLAGGIAHDFNNLLMIVLGYAEVLLAQTEDPLTRRSLSAIQQAAERGAALTQQLLTFSKKQAHEPAPVDLNRVISATEQMLLRILGENVILKTSLAEDLVPVVADRTQIEQIILNLALNARDAMPDGGRLRIETGNVFLDEDFCQRHLECAPGKYAGITVSDTGIGMSPEIQARIFEPFFTTKPPGKGTGLGLATVYGCVKQNGGTIAVSSSPAGTTFDIFFPASSKPAAEEVQPPPNSTPSLNQGETILLVEDEEGVRAVAKMALLREGYRVIEAQDAETALLLAGDGQIEIDLLLTDIVMPGMNGRQLADRLKSTVKLGRILLMTGYTEDPSASVYPVIRKPFTPRALAARVREVLDSAESERYATM